MGVRTNGRILGWVQMSVDDGETFDYGSSFVWGSVFVFLAEIAGFGGAGLYLVGSAIQTGRNYIYAGLLSGMLAAVFVYAFVKFLLSYRPLRISDEGVETLVFGRRYALLTWQGVSVIEKVAYFDALKARRSTMFYVCGQNTRVQFNSNIRQLEALLAKFNAYIEQYDIQITCYDREEKRTKTLTVLSVP